MKPVVTAAVGGAILLSCTAALAQAGPNAAAPGKPAARPSQAQAQPRAPSARSQAPVPMARAIFLTKTDADFRKMDADKNGTVTRAELEAFQRAVSVVEAQQRNRALFAKLDADRNGQLTQAEFARLSSAPATPNVAPTLARFDANRDQAISLVEHRAATLANFDRLDSDKDGYVTQAEMKASGIR